MSADWLAEYRSAITTLSSLLLIAGFLIIAARGSKRKKAPGGHHTLAEPEVVETLTPIEEADGPASDILALLPSPGTEGATGSGTRPSLFVFAFAR
ncbi:MAG: hypothetical protein ACRBM6_27745 [Geminicoccales bacterium]